MGFTTYIQPDPPPVLTLAERIAALDNAQRLSILDGFAQDIKPLRLTRQINVATDLIIDIYREIDEIEEECRELMRGEQIIQDAVYDEDPQSPTFGEIITPAVYNTPPATIAELKLTVGTTFDEIFTQAQVDAVIDKMIDYSEIDVSGNPIGTAIVYAAEVVK